jgi:hypothetical protein
MLHKTPVTARLSAGLALLTSRTSNSGTFSGRVKDGLEQTSPFSSQTSVPEVDQRLLTPFLALEVRAGYGFSPLVSADVGLGLMLFLPPRVARTGATTFSDDDSRATQVYAADSAESGPSGTMSLPREDVAATFLALAPMLGVRLSL